MPVHDSARICLDIGASNVRVGVAEGARIHDLAEYRVGDLAREHDGDFLAGLEKVIARAAARMTVEPGAPPPAIGIGVACVVDAEGVLLAPLGTSIPAGETLRDRVAARFGTRVVVDNDASLAALGEATHGAGQGRPDLVLITLGTNIGMGIVANGAIYRGVRGAAGEIGTLPLRLPATEDRTWQRVLRTRPAESLHPAPPPGYVWIEELYGGRALSAALSEPLPEGGRLERVLGAAQRGDAVARVIAEEAIEGWALTLATVCGVLDPGLVLLGGGITEDLKPYLGRLRAVTASLLPGLCPPIELATLGATAGLVGAAVAAR
ncbi:ROK family protein [Spongiactinospora sp. TRM90649]|uniref:ROK family protein n=1 Tax=Spongiactinospora sp. TRM90649 TaxID=3031114 RepID=UPI0023F99CA5|nr:ROK family protein [Spongiactinospora sp. TRM90649]MDF5753605.1 ROK family protein [Spongiactinospora sp. TRM90649]